MLEWWITGNAKRSRTRIAVHADPACADLQKRLPGNLAHAKRRPPIKVPYLYATAFSPCSRCVQHNRWWPLDEVPPGFYEWFRSICRPSTGETTEGGSA
jgi:hypothetical protein